VFAGTIQRYVHESGAEYWVLMTGRKLLELRGELPDEVKVEGLGVIVTATPAPQYAPNVPQAKVVDVIRIELAAVPSLSSWLGASPSSAAPSSATRSTVSQPEKKKAAGSVTASAPGTTNAQSSSAVPCSAPDPFAASGGVGMCVNGNWILLWRPATNPKARRGGG
jgi:hypothetical protein